MPDNTIGADTLAGILQVSISTLHDWRGHNMLDPIETGTAEPRYATAKVDAMFADPEHNRNFVTPLTVNDLLSGQVILLKPQKAAKRLGVETTHLGSLVKKGALRAIRLFRNFLYDEASIKSLIAKNNGQEEGVPLGISQIAALLAVDVAEAYSLMILFPEFFVCKSHGHVDDELYIECFYEMLKDRLNSPKSAMQWCRRRLEQPRNYHTMEDACRILKLPK